MPQPTPTPVPKKKDEEPITFSSVVDEAGDKGREEAPPAPPDTGGGITFEVSDKTQRNKPVYPSAAQVAANYALYQKVMSGQYKAQYDQWLTALYNQGLLSPETFVQLSQPGARISLLTRYEQLQEEGGKTTYEYDPETGGNILVSGDPRWASFGAFLSSFVTPAFENMPLETPEKEVLPAMTRTTEALIRSDLGLPQLPAQKAEEGAFAVDETGERVPVLSKAELAEMGLKLGAVSRKPPLSQQYQERGWVQVDPTVVEGARMDEKGDWWARAEDANAAIMGPAAYAAWKKQNEALRQDMLQKKEVREGRAVQTPEGVFPITPAEANRQIQAVANERLARQQTEEYNRRVQEKAGREARRASLVAPWVGAGELPPEATNVDIARRGWENIGVLGELTGRQNALTQAYGGLNPAQISQQVQTAREPWTQRRLGEPLAAKFPEEWEEYAAPRTYGWAKGAASLPASSFSAEEPFDMSFKDFLQRREEISALSPPWAKPPREGEYRAPIANWGFKQPWAGGPAPRAFGPSRRLPRYAEMRGALKKGW